MPPFCLKDDISPILRRQRAANDGFWFFPQSGDIFLRYNDEIPRLADTNSMATVQLHQHGENDEEVNPEWIQSDASFSPVLRVNHSVDSIRVGEELNHDLLNLTVTTNGTVSPDDAVKQAVSIL